MEIYRFPDYPEMCHKAAQVIATQMIKKPASVLGLATGSTPIGVYSQLVDWHIRGDLDFGEVYTFNLDEYCGLSRSDPQSYHYFMNEHLFSKVNADKTRVHIPDGRAGDIDEECARYDALIASCGGIDLQLLGLGGNGHIGFNEPDSAFAKGTHCVELDESTIDANARFFERPEDVPRKAITMGIQSIMRAKKILLIANGEKKKDIFAQALYGPITPAVPASVLQLHPDLTVVWSDA